MTFGKLALILLSISLLGAPMALAQKKGEKENKEATSQLYDSWRDGNGSDPQKVLDLRDYFLKETYTSEELLQHLYDYLKAGGPPSAVVAIFSFYSVELDGVVKIPDFQKFLAEGDSQIKDPDMVHQTFIEAFSKGTASYFTNNHLIRWYTGGDRNTRLKISGTYFNGHGDQLRYLEKMSPCPKAFLEKLLEDVKGDLDLSSGAVNLLDHLKLEQKRDGWMAQRALNLLRESNPETKNSAKLIGPILWGRVAQDTDTVPEEILKLLEDPNVDVKSYAYSAIGKRLKDQDKLQSILSKGFYDQSFEVSWAAIHAFIANVANPREDIKKNIFTVAREASKYSNYAYSLYEAIEAIPRPNSDPFLIELINIGLHSEDDSSVKYAMGIMAVRKMDDPEMLGTVILRDIEKPENSLYSDDILKAAGFQLTGEHIDLSSGKNIGQLNGLIPKVSNELATKLEPIRQKMRDSFFAEQAAAKAKACAIVKNL